MIDDGINPLGRVILVLSARESADGTDVDLHEAHVRVAVTVLKIANQSAAKS